MVPDLLKQRAQRERGAGDAYEARDASSKWIFSIIGGLFLALITCEVVLGWVTKTAAAKPQPADQWAAGRQSPASGWTQASFPRLQVSPAEDLKSFRAREEAELSTYGWINRTAGVVRIPIDRAMDLLLQRGLPVRPAMGQSRLGPTPIELQQQRTNSTEPETRMPR